MTSCVITIQCAGPGLKIPNKRKLEKQGVDFTVYNNRDNVYPPVQYYNWGVDQYSEDILIYTHDDLTIHDPNWHDSLMSCFQDQTENYADTVAVGFGGAPKLGHPNLYKRPYRIDDLARSGYCSNQTDAETHGERFTGTKQVAVLDAFIMAVRRSFIISVGGWPSQLTHHGLDMWLACEAARHNKQVWMTGVDCTHHGGGSSIKSVYANASWLQGGTLDSDHKSPHLWLYDSYRDVLPINVNKF